MQEACNEGQRCDSAAGATQGTCVKLARECIGRVPDEPFCDESTIRACNEGAVNVVQSCTAEERCVELSGQASCECAIGKAKINGQCQQALSCGQANGGCDALTQCSMAGATPVCADCPLGYSGSGVTGCAPILLGLESDALLNPPLTPSVRALDARLPLVRQQISLTPRVADGVDAEINGAKLERGTAWLSDVLSLGEHPLALTLTAPNGSTTRYEFNIERAGVEETFLKAPNAEADDTFGYAIGMSGDTMVLGAPSEDGAIGGVDGDQTNNAAYESGAAFVFVRQGSSWQQQGYLKAPMPKGGEYFGASVAIAGDMIVVGSPRDSFYPNPLRTEPPHPGSVNVYVRQNGKWSHEKTIDTPSSTPDWFGFSVAINNDTILIGAPNDSSDGNRNSGAIYQLPRGQGGSWQLPSIVKPKQSAADLLFGWSIAVGPDAFLVGAPERGGVQDRSGKVFSYIKAATGWQEQQTLVPPESVAGATYGWSVALDGTTAAVGAPCAALLANTPHGQAYVYSLKAGVYELNASLKADVPRMSDYFGSAVSLSGDSLLVGAGGDASGSAGLKGDPNRSDLSQAGALYLFGRQPNAWTRSTFIKASNPAVDAGFGQSALISGDTIVANGQNESTTASGSGAIYVFR